MKLSKPQLLETIRDTIYEVLEEEIDRRIKKIKHKKMLASKRRLTEARAAKAKIMRTVKARSKKRALIKKRKEQLKEAFNKLTAAEKKLKVKK